MHVISVSTLPLEDESNLHLHRQPRMMRESIQRFGVDLKLLGLGAQHEHTCRYRIPFVLEYLRPLPPEEIVLFTDSWDAFFVGTTAELEKAFLSIGSPVVFSPECNLWPPQIGLHVYHPPAPTRWRYACGGGWAGYAGALRDMLSAPDFWPDWAWCDQEAFAAWTCTHHHSAVVDHYCRLFICIYDDGKQPQPTMKNLVVENGRLRNLETDSYPLVCHGGGGYTVEAGQLWKQIKQHRGWE